MPRGRRSATLETARSRLHEVARFTLYVVRRFYQDECLGKAAALTFTALLALVPLTTVVFSIFTAFPAFERFETEAQHLIFRTLVPQVGQTIIDYLDRFLENAGQLTVIGALGLVATSILVMAEIESAFNSIWRTTEPRPLYVRILAFWTILTLFPLLFGASLSVSSYLFALAREAGFAQLMEPLSGFVVILPGLFEIVGATLLYIAIPNRTVPFRDALTGGLVAAVLLEVSKGLFGLYLASYPVYQTIYGALATVPIFLLWLFIAWSTLLLGAVVTAALPEWRAGKITRIGPEGLLSAQRVVVALAILRELMNGARLGVGLRTDTLIHRVPVGAAMIEGMLQQLRRAHWVTRTGAGTWVCTRDLSEASLYDLLRGLDIGLRGSVRAIGGLDMPWLERAAQLLEEADEVNRTQLGVPLKTLFEGTAGNGLAGETVALRRVEHRS